MMGMDDVSRAIGNLEGQLDAQGKKLDDHSEVHDQILSEVRKIASQTVLIAPVVTEHKELKERVSALEAAKLKIYTVAATISTIFAVIGWKLKDFAEFLVKQWG